MKNVGWDIFLTLLSVLFIGLKLTGHISWSWWWVLSPLWGPAVVFLIIVFLVWMIRGLK